MLALLFATKKMECKHQYPKILIHFNFSCFLYDHIINDILFVLICHDHRTSVAHLDSPGVVDLGLAQMLSLIFDNDEEAKLDV